MTVKEPNYFLTIFIINIPTIFGFKGVSRLQHHRQTLVLVHQAWLPAEQLQHRQQAVLMTDFPI
jgi:hypothetical protein